MYLLITPFERTIININEKGEDNYSELTRNIYRNFTDKKLFRDRVVNKERCTTLDGRPLINKE